MFKDRGVELQTKLGLRAAVREQAEGAWERYAHMYKL